MIEKKLIFITIICNVKCQFLPVTVSCSQANNIPSTPIYTKVCALSNPTLAVTPPTRAQYSPLTILNPKTLAGSNQQLVCPIEYTVVSPTALPLPISSVSTAPATYCPPISIPSHCPADNILQDCLNDLCWPEVVFDSRVGCLDPILSTYGTINEVPVSEISPSSLVSPFLPAASPVSSLATVSPLLPPLLPSESSCHFLKKISIPPPFI